MSALSTKERLIEEFVDFYFSSSRVSFSRIYLKMFSNSSSRGKIFNCKQKSAKMQEKVSQKSHVIDTVSARHGRGPREKRDAMEILSFTSCLFHLASNF